MTTLIAFLCALAILIFVHELGHYLVARLFDVKVLRFSIGFGTPLIRFTVGADKTEWTIAPIPLGGYVRMLDEREGIDESVPEHELARAFNRQSLGRRSLIVLAGPVANFLLAIALYAVLGWSGTQEPAAVLAQPGPGTIAAASGFVAGDRVVEVDGRKIKSLNDFRLRLIDPVVDKRAASVLVDRGGQRVPLSLETGKLGSDALETDFLRTLGLEVAAGAVVVGSVLPDGSAARAGLLTGDQILAIDGRSITRPGQVVEHLRGHPGQEVRLDVERARVVQRIVVVPQPQVSDRPEDAGRTIGRIGAALQGRVEMVEVSQGFLGGLAHGVHKTWEMSWFSLRMLGKMLVGDLSWRNLSGPVAIADYAGQSAKIGVMAYIGFLALISVSLGVLNLLPVPVLDGGHLVYYGLEAIKGRPLSERFMQMTQRIGIVLVAGLMVVALFNDITRLIGG
ncbi:MAG: RIP metalloprotease RseP [Burkholderiaceae bacterium]